MRLTVLVLRRNACGPLSLANVRPYLIAMIIGRRHFIQSAIAGASLLAAPSTATDIVFAPGTGSNTAGAPSPLLLSRAKAALDMGFYISISGIMTFRNADELRDVVKKLPMDRLLIETDSPYLAPVPFRGKTNQPAYVTAVAEAIAQVKDVSLEQLAQATTENFYNLFKWVKKVA